MHPFLGKAEHAEALEGIRGLLERGKTLSEEIGVDPAGIDGLLAHLYETFLLVVVGEVKSGKSLLVNALLRRDVCRVGATPVTDRIHILRYGDEEEIEEPEPALVMQSVPSERLRGLSIVDTPGTNSIIPRHEEITRRFLPRADLVLFVTSCDRPYSASESAFLHLIAEKWRRKIVFVLSKTDIKEPEEVEEILAFVHEACEEGLGFTPTILPVAVKPARAAIAAGGDARGTGLPALERYILERLDDREKLRLRLTGVIDAASAILAGLIESVREAAARLEGDSETLSVLNRHVVRKREELHRERHEHLAKLRDVFAGLRDRGGRFLEGGLPMVRVFRSREKLEARFKEKVVADLEARLAEVSDEALDWVAEETLRFSHFAEELFRVRALGPGEPGGTDVKGSARFREARDAALATVRGNAADHIERLVSRAAGGEALAETRLGAKISFAGLGTGVLAGAVLAALLGPTGALAAIPFLAGGVVVFRTMRSKAQLRWMKRVDTLATEHHDTFSTELMTAVDAGLEGVREIYVPYSAFHEAQVGKQADLEDRLTRLGLDLDEQRRSIEGAIGSGGGQ